MLDPFRFTALGIVTLLIKAFEALIRLISWLAGAIALFEARRGNVKFAKGVLNDRSYELSPSMRRKLWEEIDRVEHPE